MKKIFFVVVFVLVGLMSSFVAYAITWPSSLTRHNDILMPDPYEPSGLAWNPVTNKLFTVSDKGKMTMMDMDGKNQDTKTMTSYMDFEAITIADPTTNKVYIGDENPDSILEYDWQTKTLTGKSWNLTSVMTGADNSGLEGLTFVPNGYHPYLDSASGGIFYAGIQRTPISGGATNDDYLIYAFDIDLNTSGKIVKWWGIPVAPNTPTSDISDLYFSKDTGILYVLYDGANRLIEMKTDGTVIQDSAGAKRDYSNVPIADQEGLAVKTNYPSLTADIYLASDSTKSIGWFSGYPVNYDVDKDGVENSLDCAINNSALSVKKNYYQDLDGDGLGSDVTIFVCALTPPAGYVVNSDDLDDNDKNNDFDKDGITTLLDCNDKDSTVSINQTYYKDLDGDGLGFGIAESVCSSVSPAGYVSNSSDKNDNDYDNDGVNTGADCNDKDKTIFANQIYYQDLDKDGLGSDVTSSVCSLSVPAGYVSNSSDKNDNDYDNDGVSTGVDCNDTNNLLTSLVRYFKDADNDTLGDVNNFTDVCSLAAPAGYVVNSNDANDNDYDNDGVEVGQDCDDNNSAVGVKKAYYKDTDKDGLGSKVVSRTNPIFSCSLVPPIGYVSNNLDRDDNDYDNDGVTGRFDCNDKNPLYSFKKVYYRDRDGDGLGDLRKRYYGCVPPKGYVLNFKDKNDNNYDNNEVSLPKDPDDRNPKKWMKIAIKILRWL